jgi:peptidoglycan/LPS O-acetylase OafA/YrhL
MKKKIPELDGLRAIAIILVINAHFHFYIKAIPFFNPITTSGWFGVQLFFLLSSFLLSLPYIQAAIDNREQQQVWQFYRRRILRICPLYYFSILVFVASIYLTNSTDDKPTLAGIIAHLFFLNNFPIELDKINSVYWSLAVEWHFYLIMPLIGLCLYQFLSRQQYKKLTIFLFCLLLIPIIVRTYGGIFMGIRMAPGNYMSFVYFSSLSNLDAFVSGIAGAIIYAHLEQIKKNIPTYFWKAIFGVSVATLYYLMYYYHTSSLAGLTHTNLFNPIFFHTTINLAWLGLLLSSLVLKTGLWKYWRRLLNSRTMEYIAVLSYSLYIWHLPINNLVAQVLVELNVSPSYIFNLARLFFATVITLIISHVTYHYLELPILKLKNSKLVPELKEVGGRR